jgi:hypothetical protein
VDKVYNLCRVKTNISVVLTVTVKNGLNPHIINKLENKINRERLRFCYICYISSVFCNVSFGTNLYLSNQMLIKFNQLKLLITVNQSCFWYSYHLLTLLKHSVKEKQESYIDGASAERRPCDQRLAQGRAQASVHHQGPQIGRPCATRQVQRQGQPSFHSMNL